MQPREGNISRPPPPKALLMFHPPGTTAMKHPVLSVGLLVLEANLAYIVCVIDATVMQENFQNSDL